jgi:hypothetical protein
MAGRHHTSGGSGSPLAPNSSTARRGRRAAQANFGLIAAPAGIILIERSADGQSGFTADRENRLLALIAASTGHLVSKIASDPE